MAFGTRMAPGLALAVALAACLPIAGCGEEAPPPEAYEPADLSAEAATVNGQIIYVSDVELEARMDGVIKPGENLEPGSEEFDAILEKLIGVKLLAMEALGRGLDEEPESRHRLNTARDNILGNILLEHIAAEEIDEAAIRKMYEAQVQLLEPQMENEARVRHILAPNKETIDKIAAELKTGVDFAVLAARRSSDEATRLDGGDLGYITAEEASPEFARVIREVPEGGVSRPFEDKAGWHIVKIEQVRKRRPPSIDVLRETIERYLKSQQLEKIMKELRSEAEIVKHNAPRSSQLDTPAATAPARVEPPAATPQAAPVAPADPAPSSAPAATTPPATTQAPPPAAPATPAPGAPQ